MQLRSLIFISLIAFSCSKGSSKEEDRVAPIVNITAPVDNTVVTGGSQISITATVTDNAYLKEIHLEIINLTTSAEALHLHIHPGGTSYVLNQPFTIAAATNYEIRVIAEDPAGQLTSSKVRISGN